MGKMPRYYGRGLHTPQALALALPQFFNFIIVSGGQLTASLIRSSNMNRERLINIVTCKVESRCGKPREALFDRHSKRYNTILPVYSKNISCRPQTHLTTYESHRLTIPLNSVAGPTFALWVLQQLSWFDCPKTIQKRHLLDYSTNYLSMRCHSTAWFFRICAPPPHLGYIRFSYRLWSIIGPKKNQANMSTYSYFCFPQIRCREIHAAKNGRS